MSKNESNIPTNPDPDKVPKGITLPTRWVKVSHLSAVDIAARYPYAAYGSNLDLVQMAKRCPTADIVSKGIIPDARLVFAYYCGIVADKKTDVPVGIYRLQPADVMALDRYEGLRGGSYERYLVTVMCDQVAVRCMTYVKRDNKLEAPSDRYYETVAQGYRDWSMDDRRLRHARTKAVAEGRTQRTVRAPSPPLASYDDYEPMGGNGSYYGPFGGKYGRGDWQNKGARRTANGNQQRLPFGSRGVEVVKSLVTGRDLHRPIHADDGRIDERAPLAEFKRRIEECRVPKITPQLGINIMGMGVEDPTRVSRLNGNDQNEFTNANGERWVKDAKNVWRRVQE